jgi:hypothetical protein
LQGCQMVYLHTKNTKFLVHFGRSWLKCKIVVYLRPIYIFCTYLVPNFVYFTANLNILY